MRSHDKARGGRIASYLTDDQRSHAGWIGASKCEVIFERVLMTTMRSAKSDVVLIGAGIFLQERKNKEDQIGKGDIYDDLNRFRHLSVL